jgi:hypothetical protein
MARVRLAMSANAALDTSAVPPPHPAPPLLSPSPSPDAHLADTLAPGV